MNHATATTPASGHRATSAHRSTKLVRRFFTDVLARGSERAADELIAPDAIIDLPTGRFSGPAGVKRASAQIGSVFPDLRVEVSGLVAEGERVTARWRLCGTEQRELFGVPPSGEWTCLAGLSMARVSANQIIELRMTEG
jgi:predicted ester cyclase